MVLGCGLLGQKVGGNPFSLHPSEEHLLRGLFVRQIGTLLPKKVPKQKTCPIPRKRVICDYLLLNYITGKKCKISCSTTAKTTCTRLYQLQKRSILYPSCHFVYERIFNIDVV